MAIRHATPVDLPEIVAIYNASIPGRMATADLAPVSVADRRQWFADFDPARRPIWVACDPADRPVAWLSLRSFYGRPAYDETVEVGLYTAPAAQRRGHGRALLAFTFAHNAPSLALFRNAGFADWGFLPGVAKLDGVRRDVVILGRAL